MSERIDLTQLRARCQEAHEHGGVFATPASPEQVLALIDTIEAAQALEWRGLPDTWATRRFRDSLARYTTGEGT